MKTTLFILFVTAAAAFGQTTGLNAKLTSADPKSPKILVVPLGTGTNIQASATNLQFTYATLYGYTGFATNAVPTNNSAAVAVGWVDNEGRTTNAASPIYVDSIAAGSYLGLGKTGVKYDLKDLYFRGSTGDKVIIVFEQ